MNNYMPVTGGGNIPESSEATAKSVLEENAKYLKLAKENKVNYILIDDKYEINIDL